MSSVASPSQAAMSSAAPSTHSPASSTAPAVHSPTSSPASTIHSCASSAAPVTHSPASATASSVHAVAAAISAMPVASLMAPSVRCSPRMTPPTAATPTPSAPAATLAPVPHFLCRSATACTPSPLPGTGTAICMPGFAPAGSRTVMRWPGLFGSASSSDAPAFAGTRSTVMLPGGKMGLLGGSMPTGGRICLVLRVPKFCWAMVLKLYS
mmetsp:Transcript_3477/g.10490  ORF Transcript_3477/g.10490 Transcript_3477/m.10490 type:complete len:210 (-) Transcript_3477:412-1041(-)